MATKRRWVCPQCGRGALGVSRPRQDDIVRFCFRCSTKAGRLVLRTCPVLDQAREKKVAKRKVKQAKKREKRNADPRVRAEKMFQQFKKLKSWPQSVDDVTIRVTRVRSGGQSGYAYVERRHITLRVVDDDAEIGALLLHEMTHHACPTDEWHGDIFRAVLTDVAREVLGEHFRLGFARLHSVYDGLDVAVRAGFVRKFWNQEEAD